MTTIDTIGFGAGLILAMICAYTVGYMVGHQTRKPKVDPPPQILMGFKHVDNRRMPDYSRAERRAHKRRAHG